MADGRWKRAWRPTPVLTLEERGGPGGVVYARWWVPGAGRAGRWTQRSTGLRIRHAGAHDPLPAAEHQVLDLGARMHAALSAGRDPMAVLEGRLRLGDVMDAYLRSETDGLSLRHRRDLERAGRVITGLLGADTPWDSLTPSSVRTLWRAMAEHSRGGRGERWAIRVAELLWRVGAWWSLEQGRSERRGLAAPTGWRLLLHTDWARIGRRGKEAPLPHRPRYTEEEARRLWACLETADPRLRLAVELGAPGPRLTHLARIRRSDLQVELGVGVHGLGRVRLRGGRGKAGVIVDLDRSARRALDDALTGLLAEREAAYRSGRLRDYAIVPGGRLRDGVAPIGTDPLTAISMTTLRTLYEAWERSADVPSRGLRASRRLGVDMGALDGQTSSDVQDHLGGWVVGSGTRQRVYRDGADVRARAEAERLRARIRARLRAPSTSTERRKRDSEDRAG